MLHITASRCSKDELYNWVEGECVARPDLGEGCEGEADVVFLLDSSSNVGAPNFEFMKVGG